MKLKPVKLFSQAGISLVALTLFSCGKGDRIEKITADLDKESYSLSFEKPLPEQGIMKTSYGAESYLVFADPGDLICGDPIRKKYPRIPVVRIPKLGRPTCPDWVYDKVALDKIRDLINPQFEGLRSVALQGGGNLFVTNDLNSQYSALKFDMMDDSVLNNLDHERFLIMSSTPIPSMLTRDFYGYADLNNLVLSKYKLKLKDILKPRYKGCFDPQILSAIRERLIALDPKSFGSLQVTALPQDDKIGLLSYQ